MRRDVSVPVVRDVDAAVDLIICEAEIAGRAPHPRTRALEVVVVDVVRCRSWYLSDGLRARGTNVREVSDEPALIRVMARDTVDVVVIESDSVGRFQRDTFGQGWRRAPLLMISWTPRNELWISPLVTTSDDPANERFDVEDVISQFADLRRGGATR